MIGDSDGTGAKDVKVADEFGGVEKSNGLGEGIDSGVEVREIDLRDGWRVRSRGVMEIF